MYDENNQNSQDFGSNMNPDEHKAETTSNFTMQDSDRNDPASGEEGGREPQSWQPQSQTAQSQASQFQSVQPQDKQPEPAQTYYQASQPQSAQQPGYSQSSYDGAQERTQYRQPQFDGQGQYQQGGAGQQNGAGQQKPYGQSQTSGGYQSSYIPQEPVKKAPKEKNGMGRKVAGITAAALLFGVISGGTMVGINTLADSYKKPEYPQVSQSETLPDQTVAKDGEDSGSAQANVALATDVSSIVEQAMPSVVAINNTMLYQGSTWFGQTQTYEVPSSGSGIIVGQNDEELLIVTNNHVVEDSNTLSVVFIDDTSVNAAIKGTDSESDLAVVAVPLKDVPEGTLSQISIATLGDSDDLKVGQGVIAIGNALGYGQSVTVGYVSALNREVKTDRDVTRNLLQTDAAINPGNSGGALLNMKGEVIGINAAKYSSTEVEGMGYAIPISKAQDIINNLMTKKTRNEVDADKAGYLGIQGQNIDEETARMLDMPTGIFVYKIIEGGAASKTDLREKDIIVKFDDQTVKTMANLQDMLKYYEEGETVDLTVKSLENGAYVERTVTVTLGSKVSVQTNQESGE